MSNDARRLAAMVDSPEIDERGNLAFRKDLGTQVKVLFESFSAPLAGMFDAPFADLLRTMAAFPTYSLGSQALIAVQAPGSCCLSSAGRWADFDRRVVNNARAIYIWESTDNPPVAVHRVSGYERPSIDRARLIASLLGLRVVQDGEYQFDPVAICENALWDKSKTWRTVRSVRLIDGGDHIGVKLLLNDRRVLDGRARTMIGLVKTLMQAGTVPNDESIAAYLNGHLDDTHKQSLEAGAAPRPRDFLQRFKLV